MNKFFNNILNSIAKKYKEDPSQMLIITGIIGWITSAAAQVGCVIFDKEISKDKKSFLIPQEILDAVINVCSFFAITRLCQKTTAKLFSTGKFAPQNVRTFLEKNTDKYGDKIGKLDFNLGEVLQKESPNLLKEYDSCKTFATTLATLGGSIISSNIVTPILRNSVAADIQKAYIENKDNFAQMDKENNNKPTFKASPYYNCYKFNGSLKI